MAEKKKVVLFIMSDDFDKALAAFFIASGAASMGMDVYIFLTFWGLNIIKKNKGRLIKGKNWKQKMLNIMNRGGSKRLKLSKLNMGGMGKMMMKMMMKDINAASLEQLIQMAKEQGVKFSVCDMTRNLMGLTKEDFIDGINNFDGVATYLNEVSNADVSLFI